MNVPLVAEQLTTIAGFPVTNAYVNSTIMTVTLCATAILCGRSLKAVPGRLQGTIETVIDTLLGYFDQVTGSRDRSKQFLPLVGTLFFFILFSNWMGLLPGTGSIGVWHVVHGELELVPILRPANSDLNLTLALAVVSIAASHLLGIISVGFFVHWNRFIQLGTVWQAIRTLNPIKILVALVEFIVGFIELFSEFAKIASLSLRLFGNIFAGEVLMTVIGHLVSSVIPLPFMLLELLVGLIQATVFSMLTLVYVSILTTAPHGHNEAAHEERSLQHAPQQA
jgi:F-type H+-transporting ATPase subunit a